LRRRKRGGGRGGAGRGEKCARLKREEEQSRSSLAGKQAQTCRFVRAWHNDREPARERERERRQASDSFAQRPSSSPPPPRHALCFLSDSLSLLSLSLSLAKTATTALSVPHRHQVRSLPTRSTRASRWRTMRGQRPARSRRSRRRSLPRSRARHEASSGEPALGAIRPRGRSRRACRLLDVSQALAMLLISLHCPIPPSSALGHLRPLFPGPHIFTLSQCRHPDAVSCCLLSFDLLPAQLESRARRATLPADEV
jgi:hypothetical protein